MADPFGPAGNFLRDSGAVDGGDLMWQRQETMEKRMVEKYGKQEERSKMEAFRRAQESTSAGAAAPESPLALNFAKKESAKAQQAQKEKKLLASLVSVRKKHLEDGKEAGEPAKRAKTSTESAQDGGPKAEDGNKDTETKPGAGSVPAAGGNALSALGAYSDSEEES